MANIKFSQLPNLGNISPTTIVPVVDSLTNYTVTAANLQAYVNNTSGNIAGGNISATGNVSGANIVASANVVATGNVSGTYILGDGSLLTGLPATYGNANVAAYLPTFTGNLAGGNATITANIAAGGVKTDNYYYANGTPISFAGTYGNANVAAYLPTYTGGMSAMTGAIATTANIAGAYFIGNGSALTGITGTSSNSFSTISANGTNIVADSSTDTLTFTPGTNISITGNATSDTITIGVTGTVANATYATTAGTATTATSATTAVTATSATTATTAGTVTSASQPAITSVGTLTSLAVSGNISGGNITGNGSGMTGIVTSIIAGSGISVNQATGAVTITNTGAGGTPTSIANGTSNVSVLSSGGNIEAWAGGRRQIQVLNLDPTIGFIPVTISGLAVTNLTQFNGNTAFNGSLNQVNGSFTVTGSTTSGGLVCAGTSTLDHLAPNQATTDRYFEVPVWTRNAAAGSGGLATGAVGRIIAISNSPTQAGKMAYWSTTSNSWRYISDDTAI